LLSPTLTLQLLEKLDYAKLEEKGAIADKADKWTSHKEQYICHYSKALFMAEQYPRCIEFCHSVLEGKQPLSKDTGSGCYVVWLYLSIGLTIRACLSCLLTVKAIKPDCIRCLNMAQITLALPKLMKR
jgi:hypothetical protein